MKQPALTLVSHAICPFVQRAAIVLAEKSMPFERIMIDLADKPDWFVKLSPLGKVPLLIVREENEPETVLFESLVICEYIEEVGVGAPLHPASPLERARHRAWMEFSSAMLSDAWEMLNSQDGEKARVKEEALRAKLERFEAEIPGGGYFGGEIFTMVDAVVAPIFRYFDVIERKHATALFSGLEKVSQWRASLRARPSVRDAVTNAFADGFKARLAAQGSLFQVE